ncbi:MAG: acyl carrier protein [Patescibacteria group bacterium]
MSFEERLINVIADQLSVDKSKVIPEANFFDDLGADSLDAVELIMALEEEFDIEIPDEASAKILTVESALLYVEEKKN